VDRVVVPLQPGPRY